MKEIKCPRDRVEEGIETVRGWVVEDGDLDDGNGVIGDVSEVKDEGEAGGEVEANAVGGDRGLARGGGEGQEIGGFGVGKLRDRFWTTGSEAILFMTLFRF